VQTTPVVVRVAASPGDVEEINRIDTSFSCDRIYRVSRDGLAFHLDEERVEPPVEKTYPLPSLTLTDRLFVACAGDETVGFGELEFESWNGRARIDISTSRPLIVVVALDVPFSKLSMSAHETRGRLSAVSGWRPRT